ncbi:MAG: hypothetical protein A2X19_00125 [Bacteroidetes bacterium GWE2_39_28]|nr:MAG: hypothetical protein A2X19_00125 [Bacteroidetes bacterium GWE2_39_28]OFY14368.1 MAG: hypothetical protein A2X16_05295 [Bacteroidetes bacterium GWF2_39_10]OFZ07903.1 MAG: hypothetical protein A2322_03790 [Bacteroidetes bacterium RIFOXYB2_FULL_39_7]OFZ10295.1 MAG: hypothetical protein A2465_03385 [Bacteroidetes bacterium RIFOXYC2_FULL_39_11]HCT95271.1 hypothetical protein [Rikenellaceae bacterium]
MKSINKKLKVILILGIAFWINNGKLTANPGEKKIEYYFSQTLFTTFSFINMGKYYDNDTLKMNSLAIEISKKIDQNLTENSKREVLENYLNLKKRHGWMLDYVSTMIAINSSIPPEIEPLSNQIITFDKEYGTNNKWILDQLESWKSIFPLLNKFWVESRITDFIREYQPIYDSVGAIYLAQAQNVVDRSLQYLKVSKDHEFAYKSIKLIINLIGPEGEMGPEFCNIKYDIKGYNTTYTYRPHEMLHSLVSNLTKSQLYESKIEKIVDIVWSSIKDSVATKSYPTKIIYFDECLVRALDYRIVQLNKLSYNFIIERQLANDQKKGFVLVAPILSSIMEYEKSGKKFHDIFDRLLIMIDENLKNQINSEKRY